MPLKSGKLARGEAAFLDAFLELGDRVQAEKRAGLAPRSGYAILNRPEVQARYADMLVTTMRTEIGPLAVARLRKLLTSDNIPASAQVAAVKIALDKVFPSGADGGAKELHEMTPDELARAINTLEGMAGAMAKPVQSGGIFD
jgi:hypothetical protein